MATFPGGTTHQNLAKRSHDRPLPGNRGGAGDEERPREERVSGRRFVEPFVGGWIQWRGKREERVKDAWKVVCLESIYKLLRQFQWVDLLK